MVFSSIPFICAFLPVVFLIYLALPGVKSKNIFLIAVSLFFYAIGESMYVFLMIGCVLWNYLAALIMSRAENGTKKKLFLAVCVGVDLIILAIFKYSGLVMALPIGISFYTFQAISYVADVYKGKLPAEVKFGRIMLYISFFPQLIAGPIVRYQDIADDIKKRRITQDSVSSGLRLFIVGLSKKVLISDNVGQLADYVYALSDASLSLPVAWMGAVAYTLQIYFDFSGYSDMAVGLGRMFGFHLPRNFNYPYIADSMLSFWKRWHITLTDWFREYLYIPLGGNRKGKIRTLLNRMIIFTCVGIWHGAGLTFLVWGVYHGLLTVLEVLFPNMIRKMGILRHVYTLAAVIIGFVIFRADNIGQAAGVIGHMFVPVAMDAERMAALMAPLDAVTITSILAGVIASTPVLRVISERIKASGMGNRFEACAYALSVPMLVLCIMSLAGNGYHPFIYFRF
ncbi:MAG: MBOAT family protein [Lachnospiraceae bacterium]|nr:MBOAT family protein [Lachnospiraceae bacterium]